ncbi:MAG TPA: shikimate kinase [Acidimicrobiia bacterium]|nr:shikimate kinase [Acidimicrobiia bacterium]
MLPADRHLVLTGPMGSGKTTVGKELARRLGRPFFDSDEQIRAAYRVTGRELAAAHGVARLHRVEAEALRVALASDRPSVIAAAASVADSPDLEVALSDVSVVLLGGQAEVLEARARKGGHRRPVPVEGYAALSARRAERLRPIVSLEVDVTNLGPDDVVSRILSALRSLGPETPSC